jgi:hypothetical protein
MARSCQEMHGEPWTSTWKEIFWNHESRRQLQVWRVTKHVWISDVCLYLVQTCIINVHSSSHSINWLFKFHILSLARYATSSTRIPTNPYWLIQCPKLQRGGYGKCRCIVFFKLSIFWVSNHVHCSHRPQMMWVKQWCMNIASMTHAVSAAALGPSTWNISEWNPLSIHNLMMGLISLALVRLNF